VKPKKNSHISEPLGDDFAKTSLSPGEPEIPPFPDPFGTLGPLTHRKRVLDGELKETGDDHGTTG
jgi:hypothetical protein